MKDWKRPLIYAIISLLAGALLFFLAAWLAVWLPQQVAEPQGKWLGWLVPTGLGALLGLAAGLVLWNLRQALLVERQRRQYFQSQFHGEDEAADSKDSQSEMGAASRSYFDDYLQREWRRSVRSQKPLSLILCGVNFQPVDTAGKDREREMDSFKRIVAIFHRHVKRTADLIAEFDEGKLAVLLPETSLEGAARVAEMLRNNIIEWITSQPEADINTLPTVSFGAASCIPRMTQSPEHLTQVTLHALEQAEKEGLIIVILSVNS